ncbi:vacuolar protein sorting-associated protein 52 homolog [Cimex lectularius]|uniref:Vacuolar protein sorting-associated protein 52 homolog n=1 Tax=Cimex lectularius TaxID=79782 RepID=A0A8I6S089_CIMLE|nr:vacuolar protein sorting-associated protein 52 homolog [Cimex lectularius]
MMKREGKQTDEALENYLEDEVVQEVLKTGTDLRQYSKQIEKQLKEVENKSIQDYIKESQNIVSLHNQIVDCDNILERMESMLLNFQTDLGSISSEIVSLQKRSIEMRQQLHNRQAVRGQLSQFIEDIVIPESLIIGILEDPVTDKDFISHLLSLNHKISFVKEQSGKDVKCCQDVRETLENLKIKAVTKIRAYLLEQISKFRKPMANYQIPQNAMLKYKFFYEFVLTNEREVAREICEEYTDTMSKIYYSYFKSYSSLLSKLVYENAATKDDLMGIEETGSRGLFHKSSLKQKSTVFTIGNRAEVLTSQFDAPIIIPHSAQKADQRFPYEALFRSEQYALVDNACREFLFICDFFIVKGSKAMDLFSRIMGKTMSLLEKNLETYVNTSYDTISLFLCVQLVLRYQMLCHKRAVPALDDYWDSLQSIIWPRFEHVFRLNIKSIKDCETSKFGKEMKPHYIARRYAEFSGAIVSISETFPNELVSRLLAQLLEEVQLFLLSMAGIFDLRSQQLVFLINNYDMILGILMERTRENCKEVECIKELLQQRSNEYVEEVLSPHFGDMIQFVKEVEPHQDNPEVLKKYEDKSRAVVQSFCNTWKNSLDLLNQEIITSFSILPTGSTLLQLALGHLLQYHERFHKLLTPNVRSQLVNIHNIKMVIKKYKTSYS